MPVPRDSEPPVDIWRRGAEAEKAVAEIGQTIPLASAFIVTESDEWRVKHITLYRDMLVYRAVEEKWSKEGTQRIPGSIKGVFPFNYNKIFYGETTLGRISKDAWPYLTNTQSPDDKSVSSSPTNNRIRDIKYIQLFDNPFEEISELFYFQQGEEMEKWLRLISSMKIININFKTKYVVQGKLGSGAYSKVYLIKDIQRNACFAAKAVFLENFTDFEKAKEVIAGEIETMHKLADSPYTPTLYEVHQVEDIVYLVMEYIEGDTLGSFTKKYAARQEMTEEIMHSIVR